MNTNEVTGGNCDKWNQIGNPLIRRAVYQYAQVLRPDCRGLFLKRSSHLWSISQGFVVSSPTCVILKV